MFPQSNAYDHTQTHNMLNPHDTSSQPFRSNLSPPPQGMNDSPSYPSSNILPPGAAAQYSSNDTAYQPYRSNLSPQPMNDSSTYPSSNALPTRAPAQHSTSQFTGSYYTAASHAPTADMQDVAYHSPNNASPTAQNPRPQSAATSYFPYGAPQPQMQSNYSSPPTGAAPPYEQPNFANAYGQEKRGL